MECFDDDMLFKHAASTVRISKRGGKMSRQPAGSGLAFSTQGVYAQGVYAFIPQNHLMTNHASLNVVSRDVEQTTLNFHHIYCLQKFVSAACARLYASFVYDAHISTVDLFMLCCTDHSRGSPRKRQGRGGIAGVPRKRLALSIGMNQLSVQVSSASPSFQTAAAARPAHPAALAAAVSSAPELSGLLQGIRVSRASVDTEQVTSAGKSFVSASLPLTRLVAVGKLTDVAEGNGGSSLTSSSSPGTLVVKPGEGSEKETQSAVIIGKALHSSQPQSQQQILVRTSGGSLSTPITIPISMAHRLVGLGAGCPLVHVTGASSSTSSQIQQLLTSIANSTSITTAAGQPTSLLLTSAIASSSGLTTTITTTNNSAGGTTTSASAGRVLVTTAPRTKLSHAAETTDPPKVERPEAEVGGEVQSEADKVQAIQRLQFHDFPLTTASLQALSTASGAVFTQAKILEAGRGTEGAGVRPAGVGGTAAVMKVGVSKSLINPGSLPTSVSSILSRVVAQGTSQAGVRAGSPLAGTSILGGKSTVLITSLGKTLTSAAAAAALGKMETSMPPATSSSTSTMTAAGDSQGKTPSFSESSSTPTTSATTYAGAISAALQAKMITGAARMAATVGPSPGCSTNAPVASTSASPATAAAVSSSGIPPVRTGPKPHHSSYTSSTKPVLLTVASTRTRRIRTPKQYDL